MFNRQDWIECLKRDIQILDDNEPIGQFDIECRRFNRIAKVLKLIKSKGWRNNNPWFFAALPISIQEVEAWKLKCFMRAAAARNKLRQYIPIQHSKWKRLEALKKVTTNTK